MDELIARFREYAASFEGADALCNLNIDLKVEHTMHVLGETRQLCAAENIDPRLSRLAGFVALFHDLSRFEQFKISGSFNDAASFDHGDRSAELAARDGWVRKLEHRDAAIVAEGAPKCPKCGKPMRKMVARKGRNAGNPFWSCTGYPDCNGTRSWTGGTGGTGGTGAGPT